MKEIKSIEEIHNILLNIIKVFHKICIENQIPYYLVYGSMLGAVRHHGFIPWDDDMDVAIDYGYYDKLVLCLKNQLPSRYKLITRYDDRGVPAGYLKIEDTHTLLYEKGLKPNKFTGVFLDIFLLYHSDGKVGFFSRYSIIKCLRYIQVNKFYKINISSFSDIIIKSIIKTCFFWLKRHYFANFIERYIIPKDGTHYCTYVTIYNKKDVIPKEIYGNPTLINFEENRFYGVEKYDEYLKLIYSEYMTLPPVSKRRIHLTSVFYK